MFLLSLGQCCYKGPFSTGPDFFYLVWEFPSMKNEHDKCDKEASEMKLTSI